jgi:hypothetical protein
MKAPELKVAVDGMLSVMSWVSAIRDPLLVSFTVILIE